jgi:hypothetical protein
VRDESHLDDMRAAIRGDFERLEERRGTQELMHVREPESLPEAGSVGGIEAVEPSPRSWLARLLAAIPPRQV